MNDDVKDLVQAKKEKINEWLEYLNSDDDDVIWIQKNRVFYSGLFNIMDKLQRIDDNDIVDKQEALINDIGFYVHELDKLKVKEIVNKLKELDEGKVINSDIDFNRADKIINGIYDKIDKQQEERYNKFKEEHGITNEQMNDKEKKVNDVTNTVVNSFEESKNQNELNDNISVSKREYERLRRLEDENIKIKRCDFALIIDSGLVLPITHPNYNNDRVKIEIFNINNHNIEIDGIKYTIKTQVLFDKIKSFVDKNLDLLIDWSKKETNSFLDNNAYDGGKSRDIQVKYGQLLISVNGQVSGELGMRVEEFINAIKELIKNN